VNFRQFMNSVKPADVVRSRWALPAVLVLVCIALAWRLNVASRAEAVAARLLEEVRLREAGLVVAAQASGSELKQQLRDLEGANVELADELERASRAAPGAKPVGVSRSSTGPVIAGGTPRAPEERGPAAVPVAPRASCLLAEGDEGEVRVDQVVLETRKGNRVLVGTAAAWRLSPPATRLFGGPFRAELTEVVTAAPPPAARARWGAGVWLGVGRDGWAAGPAVAWTAARVWGAELEMVGGGGVGSGGLWGGSVSVLVRR
jgi:hypothetical protein